MPSEINVVDLFAGPGGLGEGFSAHNHGRRFKIRMSVEKEPSAHKTLELRALVRQFSRPPKYYYEYVRGTISREDLFERYPEKAALAREETLDGPRKLGKKVDDEIVYKRLEQIKSKHNGPWIVVGGPPCQAYSLVGRARNRGVKGYTAETDERNFLYQEYLKVLATIEPDIFVMENVPGILSATVNNEKIFPRIVDELRCPKRSLGIKGRKYANYRIYSLVTGEEIVDGASQGLNCRIHCEDYGVPQARHRVILLGVKDGPEALTKALVRKESMVPVGKVVADLPKLRSGLTPKRRDSSDNWVAEITSQANIVGKELKKLGIKSRGISSAIKQAHRLKSRGGQFVTGNLQFAGPNFLQRWLIDGRIGGFLNHETKGHMPTDLGRYLYCTSFARQRNGKSPKSQEFPEVFVPDHASWERGDFADRFKVQAANRPSATITCHISKDGHSNIHPDPGQCRSLTVREAARLQTFPDNYFFEGNRTEQYVQVGNAVPPWLAKQIAEVVSDILS